jgi:hypothetical protein
VTSKQFRLPAYLIALSTSALAALLTELFWSYLHASPTLLPIAAVVVSAWYGGLGPGLLATLLGAGAGYFLLSFPLPSVGLFVGVAALISGLNEARQAARIRAATAMRARDESVRARRRSEEQ